MWELIRRVTGGVLKDNCGGYAAQYHFFPLCAVHLSSHSDSPSRLSAGACLFQMLLEIMGRFVPGDAMNLVRKNLHSLISVQQGGLLSIGVLLSLRTSSNAMISIQAALNGAYGTKV